MNKLNYLDDLYLKLNEHKANILNQRGKSDIESGNLNDELEQWYTQIKEIIAMNPPIDCVKAMRIFQDRYKKIQDIEYVYYKEDESNSYLSINIYWL